MRFGCEMTMQDQTWRRRAHVVTGRVRSIPQMTRLIVEEGTLRRERDLARWRLRRALDTTGRIVVGPWVSEIGFEVLYWVPMLRRLIADGTVDQEQVTVLSRGGAEPWYAEICAEYVDLFDYFTPEEIRTGHDHRVDKLGGQKHTALTNFDREVLERTASRVGDSFELLHPSVMYHAFRPFWLGRTPAKLALRQLLFAPIPESSHAPELPVLPEHFVAVKAYFSSCFPASQENRGFVSELVHRISSVRPVVLLATGLAVDDHLDVELETAHEVIDASSWMEPRHNLAVQTEIIRRADALLTTYGGFSYLGPFVGVPSLCFYSDRNFQPAHLALMHEATHKLAGHFMALQSRDFTLLDRMLPTPAHTS